MPMAFTCPHCGNQTQVSDEFAGMSGPCAKCGQTITISSADKDPFALPFEYPPRVQKQSELQRFLMIVGLALLVGVLTVAVVAMGLMGLLFWTMSGGSNPP